MPYFGEGGGWHPAVHDRKDRISNTGEGYLSALLAIVFLGFIIIGGTALFAWLFS